MEADSADGWTLSALISSAEIQTFGTFIRPAVVCPSVGCLGERFVGDIIWFVGQFAERLTRLTVVSLFPSNPSHPAR